MPPSGMPDLRRKRTLGRHCSSSAQQATVAEEAGEAQDASVLAVDHCDYGLIADPGKTVSILSSDNIIDRWVCDSGSTVHCSPDMRGFTDYTAQKSSIVTAGGNTLDVEGYMSLRIQPLSPGSMRSVRLEKVCYVPKLAYHLFSLRSATAQGHSFEGTSEEITLHLQDGGAVQFPTWAKLNSLEAMRILPSDELACAVLTPGSGPSPRTCDINSFHAAYGHLNEMLLGRPLHHWASS